MGVAEIITQLAIVLPHFNITNFTGTYMHTFMVPFYATYIIP